MDCARCGQEGKAGCGSVVVGLLDQNGVLLVLALIVSTQAIRQMGACSLSEMRSTLICRLVDRGGAPPFAIPGSDLYNHSTQDALSTQERRGSPPQRS